MSSFPGSPRLLKGAIVGVDPVNPLASVIKFQYNPDTLTRTLTAQTTSGSGGDRSEAMRLKGPPQETIKVDIELDAADQLERGDGTGLAPALASLEMLIYPKSALVIANEVLAATVGVIEIIPPEAPLTLFIWGIKRVLIQTVALRHRVFEQRCHCIGCGNEAPQHIANVARRTIGIGGD